jgi:hypothetical protein
LKNFAVQAAQKDLSGKAREKIGDRKRTYPERTQFERNEGYEPFFSSLLA